MKMKETILSSQPAETAVTTFEETDEPKGVLQNEVKIEEVEPDCNDVPQASNISSKLIYSLKDRPPLYLCVLFGMQHYLMSIGGLIGFPLILASKLCITNDDVGDVAKANLISSCFMTAGVCTLIQTTIGNRLPIMQGISFLFIPPVFSLLSLPRNQCPSPLPSGFLNSSVTLYNDTDGQIVDGDELWQRRMREIQGSIILASLVEVILGATGLIGFLLRFVGPLTLVPTISLIGLDLFVLISDNSEGHWGIAIVTTTILVLSSQYLEHVAFPIPVYRNGALELKRKYIFQTFPVLITLLIVWIICFILTASGALPDNPKSYGYLARTDIRENVVVNSPWFRIPYPGQWGAPYFTIAGFFGFLSPILAGIMESIGDYFACAKLVQAPTPPNKVINRGIAMEGVGCIFAGFIGMGAGTSSYSTNIAAIGITKVASRRVMQTAGVVMVIFSILGKFGSLFVTIPSPVIGGIFFVTLGMIISVGLSNLQYVNMNSNRNLFIVGFTILTGLTVSNWTRQHPSAIQTGVSELDQVITVLLSSALIIGGTLGIFLDNTLPGTEDERGLAAWKSASMKVTSSTQGLDASVYDLPFEIPSICNRLSKYFICQKNNIENEDEELSKQLQSI